MTDTELERILGAFYRAEVPADMTAPAALRLRLATIPGAPLASGRPARQRGFTLLAAAAILTTTIVGGALLGGALVEPRPNPRDVIPPSSSPGASDQAGPSARPTSPLETPQAAVWVATGSMGTPRHGHAAIRLADGRVLVVGGKAEYDFEPSDLTSAELYDPGSGTWSAAGTTAKPLQARHAATLLRDGKVLVADSDGAEVFDPETRAWTVAARGWSGVLTGFGATATLLLDGRVLVAGVHGAQLYDPINETWTNTGTMTEPLLWYSATLLSDGKVLAAGEGLDDHNNESDFSYSAQLYDPETGTWTSVADLHHLYRTGAFSATLLDDGRVLVAGGVSDGPPRSAVEIYDPGKNTWTAVGDRPVRGGYLTAVALSDGTVLLITIGASYSDQVTEPSIERPVIPPELYDPRTGSWTTTATMLQPHDAASFTLLLDGRVLAAGGLDCSEVIADLCSTGEVTPSAELYVPATGQ